jgi:hypothetical protein
MVEGARGGRRRGWEEENHREPKGDTAGRGDDSSHTIDNFEFEQTIRYTRDWNKK